MPVLVVVLLFCVGLVLIIKGGDWFVDASVWIAEASGIPKFLIGATVVSIATTIPELLVSLIAALQGSAGMACGNAVGSVTANLGLILGVLLACMPGPVRRKDIAFKGLMMLGACGLLWAFCARGTLSGAGVWVLIAVFCIYAGSNVMEARASMRLEGSGTAKKALSRQEAARSALKFLAGAAGIAIGADLLVDHGATLARLAGVSEAVIGVTLLSVGTSLPELVTTITAISRRQAALSVGNIIGANVIDLTLILPVCALASGGALAVQGRTLALDLPVCLALGALFVLPALFCGRFSRAVGILLLTAYALYMAAALVL